MTLFYCIGTKLEQLYYGYLLEYFNGATVYAIVNNRLGALELAITPNIGHDGWANVVTLSNIHERSLFISRFHL